MLHSDTLLWLFIVAVVISVYIALINNQNDLRAIYRISKLVNIKPVSIYVFFFVCLENQWIAVIFFSPSESLSQHRLAGNFFLIGRDLAVPKSGRTSVCFKLLKNEKIGNEHKPT